MIDNSLPQKEHWSSRIWVRYKNELFYLFIPLFKVYLMKVSIAVVLLLTEGKKGLCKK
jgi:hypothetical protein